MSSYIDGFVLQIPTKRIEEYQRVVESVADVWKEHGALDYREYVGDDLYLDGTKSFEELFVTSENETIIFGWVEFESREARDLAHSRVAADPRMIELIQPLTDTESPIFDAKHMAFGGFRPLVPATSENTD